MKYDDGQYHVEWRRYDGFGRYDWFIVNVFGEPIQYDGIDIRFGTKKAADAYCLSLNQCPDGAVIRNMT